MTDDEWVVSREQPTYSSPDPGVTITPIPVKERKVRERPEQRKPKGGKDDVRS